MTRRSDRCRHSKLARIAGHGWRFNRRRGGAKSELASANARLLDGDHTPIKSDMNFNPMLRSFGSTDRGPARDRGAVVASPRGVDLYSISHPYLGDEQAARAKLEAIVWPQGPVCPHCGEVDRIAAVGKGARERAKFCGRCGRQFRATFGTLFEGSHVPLYKWFQACFLLAASNCAISAHQLHLRLEVASKTALSMRRRLALAIAGASAGADDLRTRESPRAAGGGWTQTFGRKPVTPSPILSTRRRIAAGGAAAAGAAECGPMPWTMSFGPSRHPVAATPTRQFLGFLEIAQGLACPENCDRFDEVLRWLGRYRKVRSAPRTTRRSSRPGFASGGGVAKILSVSGIARHCQGRSQGEVDEHCPGGREFV